MSVLISVPLSGGGSVVIEAPEELVPAGVELAATRPGEVIQEAGQTLEEALDKTLVPVARAVIGRLREIEPQEAEITLGLKLSAEAGIVISKIAGEASIEVKLTWRRSEMTEGRSEMT
jgi:hypothetical protein